MIQRIQTLYLFAAAILSALAAFVLPMYALEGATFAATANASTFWRLRRIDGIVFWVHSFVQQSQPTITHRTLGNVGQSRSPRRTDLDHSKRRCCSLMGCCSAVCQYCIGIFGLQRHTERRGKGSFARSTALGVVRQLLELSVVFTVPIEML